MASCTSRADVVDDGVAEDVLRPIGGGDAIAGPADDGEFGLEVGLGRVFGEDNFCTGADDRARELYEDGGHGLQFHLDLGRMALVIEADTEDARRMGNGCEQLNLGEGDARGAGGDLTRRAQGGGATAEKGELVGELRTCQ